MQVQPANKLALAAYSDALLVQRKWDEALGAVEKLYELDEKDKIVARTLATEAC